MPSETAQLGENGTVTIPAAYRKAMGLSDGDIVLVHMDEDGLHIQTQIRNLLERKLLSALSSARIEDFRTS